MEACFCLRLKRALSSRRISYDPDGKQILHQTTQYNTANDQLLPHLSADSSLTTNVPAITTPFDSPVVTSVEWISYLASPYLTDICIGSIHRHMIGINRHTGSEFYQE